MLKFVVRIVTTGLYRLNNWRTSGVKRRSM